MGRIPIQWNKLWDAFKNFAIVFSFILNLLTFCAMILLLDIVFCKMPPLKEQVIEPKATRILTALDRLENAVITVDVPINETTPINFTLPVHARTTVTTTDPVPLNTGANFFLPGGGGSIRGTVNLVLPTGLQLPVELYIKVPVSQTIPIRMEVPVSIILRDTELGVAIHDLIEELKPFLEILIR